MPSLSFRFVLLSFNSQVMVFAKSYCPYCKATRSLLTNVKSSIDFDLHVVDLDKMSEDDGAIVQMELLKRTGQRTVPNGTCIYTKRKEQERNKKGTKREQERNEEAMNVWLAIGFDSTGLDCLLLLLLLLCSTFTQFMSCPPFVAFTHIYTHEQSLFKAGTLVATRICKKWPRTGIYNEI